jgi:hypothetical protein
MIEPLNPVFELGESILKFLRVEMLLSSPLYRTCPASDDIAIDPLLKERINPCLFAHNWLEKTGL